MKLRSLLTSSVSPKYAECYLRKVHPDLICRSCAQGGVTGILVQGSNGEAQHLSHDERKQAIALTRKALDDNGFKGVVVIAGTGAQSTKETKKLCVDAKEAGAAYALVLTPSVWPPQMTKANIIRFHQEVRVPPIWNSWRARFNAQFCRLQMLHLSLR